MPEHEFLITNQLLLESASSGPRMPDEPPPVLSEEGRRMSDEPPVVPPRSQSLDPSQKTKNTGYVKPWRE